MKLNAVIYSRVLIGVIALLIVGAGAGFYYASQFLSDTALETDHIAIEANANSDDASKLQRLQTELRDKDAIVKRTNQIVAQSKQYQYQDQIVRDINAYAKRTGVRVTGYNFEENSSSKSKKKSSLSGPNTIAATVNLDAPLSYRDFLKFLKAIEQNLTKMQVTGVNVSPDSENADNISNPSVGLLIYVRDKS